MNNKNQKHETAVFFIFVVAYFIIYNAFGVQCPEVITGAAGAKFFGRILSCAGAGFVAYIANEILN